MLGVPLSRLYAILDVQVALSHGLTPASVLEAWLSAGVRLIQLRAKTLASGPFLELADALAAEARRAGAVFIVNDRADIARMSGAAGVHVGHDDLSPSDARRIVGPSAIVGVSTHRGVQVEAAVEAPVDYVAIGPVFATSTKERPDPVVGLEGVRGAVAIASGRDRPVVGIGGITLARAASVIDAGAAAVAVIADLMVPDLEGRAGDFLRVLR